jgi:phage shock protein E
MKRYRVFAALLVVLLLPGVIAGCDYITGKMPAGTNLTTTTTQHTMSRWVWSNMGGTVNPSIVVDRNTGEPIRDVTPSEAFMIIGTSSTLNYPVVLDVRTPEEYADGHIHKAINIDLNSPDFKDEINKLDKNLTYVVYCHSGARSNAARNIMEESGFKHVINMTGGITDWISEGFPVTK